jgi:hypothetical protein
MNAERQEVCIFSILHAALSTQHSALLNR